MQRPTGGRESPQSAELVERFLASLRDLHVEGHVTESPADTTQVLKEILSKSSSKSVVVAGIPERHRAMVEGALRGLDADFVEDLQGKPPKDVVGTLAGADTGVTWARNGLAAEGALLEVVYDDSFKLASSLPIVHVALLESSTILRDLAEALPIVGEIIGKSPPDKKPTVSFISGPSKTGDIEMRLLYGVHGPHTIHAVILGWS